MKKLTLSNVEKVINNIIEEEKKIYRTYGRFPNHIAFRSQTLGRRLHPQYVKYRDRICRLLKQFAKKYPLNSVFVDKEGQRWTVDYAHQMHPRYCFFCKDYDILVLVRR